MRQRGFDRSVRIFPYRFRFETDGVVAHSISSRDGDWTILVIVVQTESHGDFDAYH